MDPNNSSVLYSGGYVYNPDSQVLTYVMAVSKTTDGGVSWHRDTLTTTYGMCYALRVDRTNSNIVYAGGYNAMLYKTTNAGSTWFLSNTGLSGTVYDIRIGSTKANTMYAGTSSGVFKSTNAGANWAWDTSGMGYRTVYDVMINPTNENEIYAATTSGVYKSTNAGGTWAVMNTGLTNTSATSLGIYPNNYVFVGTDGGGMSRWNIMVGAEECKASGPGIAFTVGPNPSDGWTRISYEVCVTGKVNITVYDIQGRLVRQLVNARQSAGAHCATWDGLDEHGKSVASGVYFCKLAAVDAQSIQKLILVR